MPTARPTNNDILTQLQIDMATTKGEVRNLSGKFDSLDSKVENGFLNLKGYVPADIYKLQQEAQKIINDDHAERIKTIENFIDSNGNGIRFSSDIVKNILKTVGLAAAAIIVIGAGYILLKNGGGL